MKKLLVIGLLAASSFCINAQTSSTNASDPWQTIINIGKDIGLNGNVTNFAVAPVVDYAPNGPSGNKFGYGVLGIYNVNQSVGMGVGILKIGSQTLMPQGQVELKLPLKPFSFMGTNFIGNLVVSPFVDAGILIPVSGAGSANGNVGAIAGAGAAVDIVHWLGGELSAWASYQNFSNVGQYSGTHFMGGVCQRWGF